MGQQEAAFSKRQTGIKKTFLIQKDMPFKAILRFALWKKVQQGEQWSIMFVKRILKFTGKALAVFSLIKDFF